MVNIVVDVLLLVFIFICIVLVLFLMNLCVIFLVLIFILILIGIVLMIMVWWGIFVNFMLLGGIVVVIGMFVDGLVVMVENMFKYLNRFDVIYLKLVKECVLIFDVDLYDVEYDEYGIKLCL